MNLQDFLTHAHSGWRYLIITFLAILMARLLLKILIGGKWLIWDERLVRITTIMLDVQVAMGIFLMGTFGGAGFKDHVKLEHAVTMIIAVTLAHVCKGRLKGMTEDKPKLITAFGWFLGVTAFIAIGIVRITSTKG